MSLRLNTDQNPITIPTVSPSTEGLMSAADKTKLDSLSPGGSVLVVAPLTGDGSALNPIDASAFLPLAGGTMDALAIIDMSGGDVVNANSMQAPATQDLTLNTDDVSLRLDQTGRKFIFAGGPLQAVTVDMLNTISFGAVAGAEWLQIEPGELGAPVFMGHVMGFANGDGTTEDQVVTLGWNIDAGHGQIDPTRASLWTAYESWFYTGPGDYQAEFHNAFIPPGGVERRFLSFLGQNTGTTTLMLDSHTITIAEDAGTGSAMIQVVGGVSGSIVLQSEDASRKIAFGNTNNIEITGPVNMATGTLDATGVDFYVGGSSTLGAFGGYLSGTHGYFLFTNSIARMASPASNAYIQVGAGNLIEFVTHGADRMWLSDTALYPETAFGVALGSTSNPFGDLHAHSSSIYLHADTTNTNYVDLQASPTGARTITFPDASGTVSLLSLAQTFSKSQNVASVALADAGTIATDASLSNVFTVTIAATRVLGNPTNLVSGGTYLWLVTQGGAGNFNLTYGNLFAWPNGTAPTLTTAVGSVDMITAVYDGLKLRAVFTPDSR